MPTARYRRDDDVFSVEARGKKHKAHASLRKRDSGSSRSSHKHGSHKSKRYYSESDTSSSLSGSTIIDRPSTYYDSDSASSSSDGTLVESEASSAGIMTLLRRKRDKHEKFSKHEKSRSHKSEKSVTTWKPSRHGRGGTGVREAFGLAAVMYGAFRHIQDRIRGEHTSKLHQLILHGGFDCSMRPARHKLVLPPSPRQS